MDLNDKLNVLNPPNYFLILTSLKFIFIFVILLVSDLALNCRYHMDLKQFPLVCNMRVLTFMI